MMKKFTALLLAVVMAFIMSSCVSTMNSTKDPEEAKKSAAVELEQKKAEKEKEEKKAKKDKKGKDKEASETTAATTTTTTEPQKTSRDLEQFKGKKLIAFTFDDGPYTPVTESLLERLDKYNARVTFFVLGSRLDDNESYRNTMKKAYEMGNQIASHTYSHATLTDLGPEQLQQEIDKANASVKNVIGIEPDAIRPPYGATNESVEAAMKKHIVLWSVDPVDWKLRNSTSVCNNIVNRAFDGGIVLLHDLYQTSVDAAIMAMEILQEQGYAFVTVDELAELRGVEMDTSTKYYQFMPEGQ